MAKVDTRLRLKDGQAFVRGRSEATARELVELAGDRSGEVVVVTHGYLVPADVAEEAGFEFITAEDQPAVITQPGTTTNRDEANNVGGRAKAVAEAEGNELDGEREFDPSAASVAEVNEYLANADEAERERVLAAETAGKARKGIIGEEA